MNDFNQNSQNTNNDSQNDVNDTGPTPNISDNQQSSGVENEIEQKPTPEISENKEKSEEKSIGSIIAVVIIIAVLVIGGLYYWGKTVNDLGINGGIDQNLTAEDIAGQPDESLDKLGVQGTSDEPADIEADLGLTDLDNLDAELGNIDAELNF